jgi:adiponectin receptor
MKEIHHKRTLPFEQVPSWIAENRYLRTGYRKEGLSFWAYVGSLFRFHNETCNVWLHLFGAIFFVVLGCYITVLFVPGPTVHPHLAETGPAHEFLHKIEKTKHDLVLALATTNHTADVRDSIVAKLHAIEESLNQYSSHVVQKIEGKADAVVRNIRRNLRFLLNKLQEARAGLSSNSTIEGAVLQESRGFIEGCLERLRLGAFLHTEPHQLEHYPLFIFIAGAISCLGFSAVYHLFHPINPTVCKILHKLDYAGIALLNFGSSFAAFFYYFYCHGIGFWLSIGFIFVGCFSTFAISMTDWIDHPAHTTFKGLMYGFLGISNLIPAVFIFRMIMLASEENDHLPFGADFIVLLLMGATYLFGLVFYILKIPERWVPYKFDIWCNSHAIWHFFVFLAAAEHFWALFLLYDRRQTIHCLKC